jgi:hypothetical protein
VNEQGDIVFVTAAIGVVFNVASNTQRFYFGHDDLIIRSVVVACVRSVSQSSQLNWFFSVAQHPKRNIVATGQLGKSPKILLWDTTSLTTVTTIGKLSKVASCYHTFNVTLNLQPMDHMKEALLLLVSTKRVI